MFVLINSVVIIFFFFYRTHQSKSNLGKTYPYQLWILWEMLWDKLRLIAIVSPWKMNNSTSKIVREEHFYMLTTKGYNWTFRIC